MGQGRVKGSKNKKHRTHCKQGHELTADNVYISRHEGREVTICKTCHKTWTAKTELTDNQKAYRKKYYAKTRNSFWRRFSVFKSTAKKFGRVFDLTLEDYTRLVQENRCSYCAEALPEAGCGIDRQNNKLGYTHENAVACCESCNEKKGSLEGVGFEYPRTVELLKELIGADIPT